jgi:hypothetical protein
MGTTLPTKPIFNYMFNLWLQRAPAASPWLRRVRPGDRAGGDLNRVVGLIINPEPGGIFYSHGKKEFDI